MVMGDPVRLAWYGSTGPTSQNLGLYYPGTNSPYPFLSTDFLIIDSIMGTGSSTGLGYLLSAPAGQLEPVQSTMMLIFGFGMIGSWVDLRTEAMSGPQGILPSVFYTDPTPVVSLTGTGHVVHSPGTFKPSWMASLTPGNSAT